MDNFAIQHVWLIPLLPLIGAVISGFFGAKFLRGQSHWPIWLTVGGSAVLSVMVLVALHGAGEHGHGPVSVTKDVFTWISAGDPGTVEAQARAGTPADYLNVKVGYLLDPLTAVMLCVICGIGFLITVFAAAYMKGEDGYWRFFAYLGLFIFMMTNLVMGENLLMLYLGWEGVGLCSYLLIGYYYTQPVARDAAQKAFIVNRVGDFGFAIGIMLCFAAFGTVSYFGQGFQTNTGLVELFVTPFGQMTGTQQLAVKWVPFLLMLGAFGKSAQFPLYVWLPDAMAGPTPVSALIHAATMVTAGVYMIARCSTMFFHQLPGGAPYSSPLVTIAAVGAFTALFAATIAMRQFDLKKVFAYSTVSQLGYMFVAAAVLAPVAAVFHLVTHAFFKALLFLGSGVVMHAMDDELDLRKMSGLKRVLPWTRWLMLAGCAALAGFPIITSGFYSKDEIIGAAWAHSRVLGGVLLLTSFLTAYYTFRLYFRVFHGPVLIPTHPPVDVVPSEDEAHLTPGHMSEGHGSPVAANQHTGQGVGHGASHGGGSGGSHHNHEPFLFIAPLLILAIGSLVVGPLLYFVKSSADPHMPAFAAFLGKSPSLFVAFNEAQTTFGDANPETFGVTHMTNGQEVARDKDVVAAEHQQHLFMMIASGVLAVAGIGIAFLLHKKDRRQADALAEKFRPIANAMDHKYWIDELYDAAIVRPMWRIGQAYDVFDRWVIDGAVWLVGFVPQVLGFSLRLTVQRGYLQGYAAAMLFGVVVILVAVFVL